MRENRQSHLRRKRRCQGNISEAAASICIVLPIALITGFVAWQVNQIYMIKTTLGLAAQTAARALAIRYGEDPVLTQAFPEQTFSKIKHMGIVIDPNQFSVPAGGWNVGANPPTVTVHVEFQGGKYGLPPFPNPDPLGLGQNFKITGVGTSRLE